MTPEMHEAIYNLSVFFHPDPHVVCRHVVEIVGQFYPDSMAMMNLVEGKRMVLHEVVNPHPAFQGRTEMPLRMTYCQFSMRDVEPLVLQDAANHPDCRNNRGVALGLRRYLGVPIRTSEGEVIGTLCFLDNKTEERIEDHDVRFLSVLAMRVSVEREREKMIRERIEAHRKAAERLAELNRQLQATAEEKRRFVSMVMHDLRHPLTTLRTVLYLLQNDPDPVQLASYIPVMEDRVHSLSQLLDELIRYNEIEAGQQRLKIAEIPVSALLHTCVDSFRPALHATPIQLECNIAEGLGALQTDEAMLTHILLNLLSNALKFTERGTVSVRACPVDAAHWQLEVADTGSGMSLPVQERIFEEFYRSPAHAEKAGFGLGLSIVRRLCEALRGELSLESAPDQGTKFRILLPTRYENAS